MRTTLLFVLVLAGCVAEEESGRPAELVSAHKDRGFGCGSQPFECGFDIEYAAHGRVTVFDDNEPVSASGSLTEAAQLELHALVRALPPAPAEPPPTQCADYGPLTLEVKVLGDDRPTYETYVTDCDGVTKLAELDRFLGKVHHAVITQCDDPQDLVACPVE
jgi:hypothetical protein